MKKIINFSLIIILIVFFGCTKNTIIEPKNHFIKSQNVDRILIEDIKNGDLIFVGAEEENLSGAINRVTQISDKRTYDHVGLIEKTKDSIFVLHAAPKGGAQREEISQFIKSQTSKNNNQLIIYRLSDNYKQSIPNAIATAKIWLGKPYNWTYILNDETLYCSDFIERAFRNDSIFEFIPMNFKNPNTDEIDNFWIDFYKKQNLSVPQDQPGTNPNQLAESDKLIEIGPIYLRNE